MKIITAIAAALLLTSAAALAEGAVSVRVVDAKTHRPVAGATVSVESAGTIYRAQSDKHGFARFLTVPDGRASALVQDRRYASLCREVFAVSSMQHREMTLEVTPAAQVQSPRTCALSSLVNPGEGADVYDIF